MPGSLDATDSSRPTISCSHWDSPCGRLLIASFNDKLVMSDWEQSRRHQEIMRRLQRRLGADFIEARSPTIEKAVIELQEYFSGKRKSTQFLACFLETGIDILSRAVSSQVPSALMSLTSVFGMRTGGTSSL